MTKILLVEDSPGDAGLLTEALRETPQPPEVVRAADGEEAWGLVSRYVRGPPGDRPALMVLDIGLPGDTGLDVLERIRREAPGADWPMVMLTSSMSPRDVERARLARAAGYFAKPVTLDGYLQLAQVLHEKYLAHAVRARPA
ncbi:MAG: response regulator [Thermoplasmatota archaeon]|nr:response regulator [Halobacteriales archaeon]